MIPESGGKENNKEHTCIPPIIQVVDSSLCLSFPLISRIYVAN